MYHNRDGNEDGLVWRAPPSGSAWEIPLDAHSLAGKAGEVQHRRAGCGPVGLVLGPKWGKGSLDPHMVQVKKRRGREPTQDVCAPFSPSVSPLGVKEVT